MSDTLIDANWLDYLLVAIYFGFVLGIGVMARRSVSDSPRFFLSRRSLPAWVTGLAFFPASPRAAASPSATPAGSTGSPYPASRKNSRSTVRRRNS